MSCELIMGPMMAGKTEELMRRLGRASLGGGIRVMTINSTLDTRPVAPVAESIKSEDDKSSSDPIVLRRSREADEDRRDLTSSEGRAGTYSCHNPAHVCPPGVDRWRATKLAELDPIVSKYKLVGIDEAQFYPDLVPTVRRWVLEWGIDVVVAGLSANWARQPIGAIHELACIASAIDKLTAVCNRCVVLYGIHVNDAKAQHSFRLDRAASGDKSFIAVGGAESYRPVCTRCYNELSQGADSVVRGG